MSGRANVPLPSGYTIRPYRDEDHHDARELFREGMGSLYWTGFKTSIRTLHIIVIIIISFALPCLMLSSFTAGVLSISSLLLITYWTSWQTYNSYLNNVLETDMSDIRGSYVSPRGAWFWVAEANGQLVGIVAIRQRSDRPLVCQLLRMNVHRMHRRRGIASALLDVALQEAKEFGYRVCLLYTTVYQPEAQQLYMRKGFMLMGKLKSDAVPLFIQFLRTPTSLQMEKEIGD
uniref:probable N-acetyltransferase CML1 n=1 Tax=Myxine glutinosa TaxID=7769 RepID=UPI00358F2AE0